MMRFSRTVPASGTVFCFPAAWQRRASLHSSVFPAVAVAKFPYFSFFKIPDFVS
jgi:hypothetical protein